MIITGLQALFIILGGCLIGLVLFIIGYFWGGLRMNQQEWDKFTQEYELLYDDDQPAVDQSQKGSMALYMSVLGSSIDQYVKDLYATLIIYVVICVIIFSGAIMSWYTPKGTYWAFILCFIWGAAVVTICNYYIMVISMGTITKLPLRASKDYTKEQLLKHAYGNGFILVLLIVTIVTSNLLFLMMFMNIIFLSEPELEDYQKFGISLMGYPVGMIISLFFLREGISIMSRGVLIATDLIIRNDKLIGLLGKNISDTAKISSIIASQFIHINVNFLDATLVIALFCTLPFIILTQSAEILLEEQVLGILLGPTVLLIIQFIGAIVSAFAVTVLNNDDIAAFTSSNTRLQIFLTTFFGFFFILIMLAMVPEEFTYGEQSFPIQFYGELTAVKYMGCALMGLLLSLILLGIFEIVTSHGFDSVRELTKAADSAPTLNVIAAYGNAYQQQFYIIFFVALIVGICYQMAGLVGVFAVFQGFTLNSLIFMPILFLSGSAHEGSRLCLIAQLPATINDKIHKMAWAARNYSIYLRSANGISFFLIGFLILGSAMQFAQVSIDVFESSSRVGGFLLGGSLVFFNKSSSISGVQNVLEETLRIEKDYQASRNEQDQGSEDSIIPTMYKLMIGKLLLSLLFTTLVVTLTGTIFGMPTLLSLAIAYFFFSSVGMISSIICGSSLKNSKLYNQYNPNYSAQSSAFASHLYGDVQATAIEESLGLPLTLVMVYVAILTLIGYSISTRG